MFKLEQGKKNFINRENKTHFNSVVIPQFLQEPVLKTKPIYIQKIKQIKNKWSTNEFMEKQSKPTIKTVKIITSPTNLEKIKKGLENKSINKEPFYLTKDSFTIETINETPSRPTNIVASPGENAITLSFVEPYSNSEIVNYLYSVDWGNFKAFNPAQKQSPVVIKNLENGVSYVISLKAQNKYGISESSAPVNVFTGLLGLPNE